MNNKTAILTRNFQRAIETVAIKLDLDVYHNKCPKYFSEVETKSVLEIEDLKVIIYDDNRNGSRFIVTVFTVLESQFKNYRGILEECIYLKDIEAYNFSDSFTFTASNLEALEKLLSHLKHRLIVKEE